MAVAHDATSAVAASSSSSPLSFTHTPTTPSHVTVEVIGADDGADRVTGATYGGVSMTAVTGGFAQDTAGEPGFCKLYELKTGIPSGAQTVSVSFTGTFATWASCQTQSASGACEVYTTGIVLLQGDSTLAEQSVTDGSPGSNSVRYAAGYTGLNAPPSVGANSTSLHSIDDGSYGYVVCRETTAGQGSRSIGFSSGSTDDRAFVHFAVREQASATVSSNMVGGGIVRASHVG